MFGENRNMCWNYHLTDNYTFIYDTIRLLIAHLKPVPIDLLTTKYLSLFLIRKSKDIPKKVDFIRLK